MAGITFTNQSVLGDAAAWPFHGLIGSYRPEMERRIYERQGGEMLEAAE